MTYFLEFIDADDQRLKATFVDGVKSESPIPFIPVSGDTVMIEQRIFTVVHRHIVFASGDATVMCYCRESDEQLIRKSCGQLVDLSELNS